MPDARSNKSQFDVLEIESRRKTKAIESETFLWHFYDIWGEKEWFY